MYGDENILPRFFVDWAQETQIFVFSSLNRNF